MFEVENLDIEANPFVDWGEDNSDEILSEQKHRDRAFKYGNTDQFGGNQIKDVSRLSSPRGSNLADSSILNREKQVVGKSGGVLSKYCSDQRENISY